MSERTVLISGASIAGPVLAYWLRRHGWRPTIVERAPAPRPGGQAVDVRGTARQVIERMGLMDAVRAAHTGTVGMAWVDAGGRWLSSMDATLLGDSGGAIADLEILRGDLVRILHEANRDGVEYLFGDTITALDEDADGVRATFRHAAPRRFDLVVGADGLHSTVRRLAFGPEHRFGRDLGGYLAIFGTTLDDDLHGWELMHSVPARGGGRTAALYPLREPGRARAMFLFGAPESPADRDPAGQRGLVAEAFRGDGWQVPRMLDAMRTADDFYFDRIRQVRLDTWHRGRVVLLGDAAHCAAPLGGNGTSLAVVGAYVLAGELATAADHTAAFTAYQAGMAEFVARCQRFSEQGRGALLPTSAAGIWFRNTALRSLKYLPWRGMISAGLQRTANLVTLKDYGDRHDSALAA